ncbi:MAG: type II toxin-antitoxin system VapC family toxin [Tetrasphaera sp.]
MGATAVGVDIVAFTPEHARAARSAYRRYGRNSGHPARLNYGDCMAYAVASVEGEALLFKGDDFAHTDIEAVTR